MAIFDFLKKKDNEAKEQKIEDNKYHYYDSYSTEHRARVTAKALEHNHGMLTQVKEKGDEWQVLVKG
jgi:hypothetical protein